MLDSGLAPGTCTVGSDEATLPRDCISLLFLKNVGSYAFDFEYGIYTLQAFISLYRLSIDVQCLKYVSQYVNILAFICHFQTI